MFSGQNEKTSLEKLKFAVFVNGKYLFRFEYLWFDSQSISESERNHGLQFYYPPLPFFAKENCPLANNTFKRKLLF